MIIRKAEISDIPPLSELAKRTFYQAYSWYNTPENMENYVSQYFSIKSLEKEFSEPNSEYFVIEENKNLIGYFKLGNQNTQALLKKFSHIEIERIYVDQPLQRSGIGKKMLDHLIQISKSRNIQFLWLGVWQKNEKAIAFYKKNGFNIIGTTTFVLGDDPQDDYIMALEIK